MINFNCIFSSHINTWDQSMQVCTVHRVLNYFSRKLIWPLQKQTFVTFLEVYYEREYLLDDTCHVKLCSLDMDFTNKHFRRYRDLLMWTVGNNVWDSLHITNVTAKIIFKIISSLCHSVCSPVYTVLEKLGICKFRHFVSKIVESDWQTYFKYLNILN